MLFSRCFALIPIENVERILPNIQVGFFCELCFPQSILSVTEILAKVARGANLLQPLDFG